MIQGGVEEDIVCMSLVSMANDPATPNPNETRTINDWSRWEVGV